MPILYAIYRSRASRNVWLALEAGIALEMRPVVQAYRLDDPLAADAPMNTLTPAFLAMSPAGAIPVLEDDGLILSESLAINLHLARRHGGDLGPRDGAEDAAMQQWAFYVATAIEPDAVAVMYGHMEQRQDSAEGQTALARHRDNLQRPLCVLDAHLAAHGHMVGGRFTVADINTAEIVRYAANEPGLVTAFPALQSWYAACQARPAFQRMWALRLAEPA